MKRLTTGLAILLLSAFSGYCDPTNPWTVGSDGTLNDALLAYGTNHHGVIVINTPIALTGDTTIPKNVSLRINNGGMISSTAGTRKLYRCI